MRRIFQIFSRIFNRHVNSSEYSWFNRLEPFSRVFGLDRGSAIDRRFIGNFLSGHSKSITGDVLEIGDDQYTYKYGNNLQRTVIFAGSFSSGRSECRAGDLTKVETFSELGRFDCLIATNVLNFIYDFDAAVEGLALLLKPDSGSVLATVSGLTQISRFDYERWGDYWRFNDVSIRRVFEKYFDNVEVTAYGNAPLAAASIMGLSQEEVPANIFEHHDPDFQILIAVNASSTKHM
jgi:hypothetical protein